ncbi:MAG: hypothetical protein EXR94_05705 [Gemmatimonadetes bacterium]|nr:hypothetical protein [Gemmatimonadota bacterium]
MSLVVLALLAVGTGRDDPRATVEVDRARREVVVTAGPFHVAGMPPGMKHDDMASMNDHNTPLIRFEWPVDGWLRGYSVEVVDGTGKPVDRRIVHHLIGVNFDRRQLLYANIERLFGVGQETEPVSVPKSIGVPMTSGARLGMYMAWQNETGADLENIKVRVRLVYSPPNLNPKPVSVLPLYMDVNLVGAYNGFEVPEGRSEKAWEFTMPIDGRLLGYSGHLHDYGSSVRLEDVTTGKVIGAVTGIRSPEGTIEKISRSLPGVGGDGVRLRAGRKYRVIGTYNNTTGESIPGAMAHITGIFAPDDIMKWPKVDLSDEVIQDDLAWLTELGKAGHKHGGTDH